MSKPLGAKYNDSICVINTISCIYHSPEIYISLTFYKTQRMLISIVVSNDFEVLAI